MREPVEGEFGVLDAVFARLSHASRFDRFHTGYPEMLPFVRDGLPDVETRSDGHR